MLSASSSVDRGLGQQGGEAEHPRELRKAGRERAQMGDYETGTLTDQAAAIAGSRLDLR